MIFKKKAIQGETRDQMSRIQGTERRLTRRPGRDEETGAGSGPSCSTDPWGKEPWRE